MATHIRVYTQYYLFTIIQENNT